MWIDSIKLSNRLQVPKCRNYWIIGTFPVCTLCSSQFIYKFKYFSCAVLKYQGTHQVPGSVVCLSFIGPHLVIFWCQRILTKFWSRSKILLIQQCKVWCIWCEDIDNTKYCFGILVSHIFLYRLLLSMYQHVRQYIPTFPYVLQ